MITGGVALTVLTGGVAAVVVGGVAVGGGASMITNPISKVFLRTSFHVHIMLSVCLIFFC
jgi:hypothetical protein